MFIRGLNSYVLYGTTDTPRSSLCDFEAENGTALNGNFRGITGVDDEILIVKLFNFTANFIAIEQKNCVGITQGADTAERSNKVQCWIGYQIMHLARGLKIKGE